MLKSILALSFLLTLAGCSSNTKTAQNIKQYRSIATVDAEDVSCVLLGRGYLFEELAARNEAANQRDGAAVEDSGHTVSSAERQAEREVEEQASAPHGDLAMVNIAISHLEDQIASTQSSLRGRRLSLQSRTDYNSTLTRSQALLSQCQTEKRQLEQN